MIPMLLTSSVDPVILPITARMPDSLNKTEADALANFVNKLQEDTTWNNLDAAYLSFNSENNAVINIIQDAYTLTPVGSPTYTPFGGWTIASGKYVQTNFTPPQKLEDTSAVEDGNTLGVYMHTIPSSSGDVIGSANGSGDEISLYFDTSIPNITYDSEGATRNRSGSGPGFFAGDRYWDVSARIRARYNGGSVSIAAAVSGAVPAVEIYVGCINNNGTPANYAVGADISGMFIGQAEGVSGSKLRTAFENFYTDVGNPP